MNKYKAKYDPIWAKDLFLHNDDGMIHCRVNLNIAKRVMTKHEFHDFSNDIIDSAENYEPTWVCHVMYMRDIVFGPYEDFIV